MLKSIGVVLIVLGVVAFVVQGISYTTEKEVVDIGPLQVTTEDEETIPLPPLMAGLVLVSGIGLVAIGAQKKS